MPAWEIKTIWGAAEIAGYRSHVAGEGPKKTGNLRSTCEDLALRLVTEYAAAKGLPLLFKNGANPKGVNPRTFATADAFLDVVLTSTGAKDLADQKTAVFVAGATVGQPSSLAKAQRGDLILLYDPIHHVQVVIGATADEVKIAQGNFRPPGERAGVWDRLWGANPNRPQDAYYIGAIVSEKSHVRDSTTGKWNYNGQELFKNDRGRLMIWDFSAWNDLIEVYTVQPNETLSSIAQKVLKDGNLWKRIYDNNRTAIGPNENAVRAGQKLYIWKQ